METLPTFTALCFLAVHVKLAVGGEEIGVVVMKPGFVGYVVVVGEKVFHSRVCDAVWKIGKSGRHSRR